MSTKNVILKDKNGNQLAPATIAEQVSYDSTHNVKQAIGLASGHATTANTAADMTDTSRIYVYTGSESGYTAGNWYYYSGSAWVSGGSYTDTLPTDTTLSISGQAADAAIVGNEITELKDEIPFIQVSYDKGFRQGGWYYGARNTSDIRISNTEPIKLLQGERINITCGSGQQFGLGILKLDQNTLLLDSGWKTNYTYTASEECYAYIQVRKPNNAAIIVSENTAVIIIDRLNTDVYNEIISNEPTLYYINPRVIDNKIVIKAEDMEYGTFDSEGYSKHQDRCRCSNHYIPARKGDIVVGNKNDGVDILVAITDNPDSSSPVTLYTTGWRDYCAVEMPYNGYYVFLGLGEPSLFTGDFTIYPVNSEALPDDYYLDEIQITIDTVKNLQSEPCLVFPLITDIHYGKKQDEQGFLFHKTYANMRAISKKIRYDAIVCLGDIMDGTFSQSVAIGYGSRISNYLRDLAAPFLLAIGNHDDNRYGTSLTAAQMYETYNAFTANDVVFNAATNGRDFYIDYPNFKTRFISIDSNTVAAYGYSSDTVTWFENIALDTPADYLAIVLTHASPIASQNYNNTAMANGGSISSAIESYIASGKPAIQLYGHSHVDVAFTSPYLSIATNCTKFENENGDPALWPSGAVKPTRTAKTASEDCWDIAVLRPASRKLNLVRFGAGDDREFSY